MKSIRIESFQSEWREYFKTLNQAWIEQYFELELIDEYVLSNPEEAILKDGGQILFALIDDDVIGTVALKYVDPFTMELTKMAVDQKYQGFGAGKILCIEAIHLAKRMGVKRLILYSQNALKPALYIYRKLGFMEVPVETGKYKRADVKMELHLPVTIEPIKWFDRKFDFSFGNELFPLLLERMENNIEKTKFHLDRLNKLEFDIKPNGKWSVKEHIGHLKILEPLWLKRLQEIRDKKECMTPADLNNTATDEANFNQFNIEHIFHGFIKERVKTLEFLKTCQLEDLNYALYHPRLKQPMRIIDLMYFVAEHDDHHLKAILQINRHDSKS